MRNICFRLLKGAPPGQEAVNHYISELSIVKGGNHKLDTKYRKHLAMIEVNLDSTFFMSSESGLYELGYLAESMNLSIFTCFGMFLFMRNSLCISSYFLCISGL